MNATAQLMRPTQAMIHWMERSARWTDDDRALNDAARLSDAWTSHGGFTESQYRRAADLTARLTA